MVWYNVEICYRKCSKNDYKSFERIFLSLVSEDASARYILLNVDFSRKLEFEGTWNHRRWVKLEKNWTIDSYPFGSSCSIESMSSEWGSRRMQWPLQWTLRISRRNSLCILLSRGLSMLQRICEECRRNLCQTQRLSIQPNGQTLKFYLVKLSGISPWAFVSNKWREHNSKSSTIIHRQNCKTYFSPFVPHSNFNF